MKSNTMSKLTLLWDLFWIFFKIGPATFGGGYAMMSLIEREFVDKKKWVDSQEMNDLMSLAGSAPGGVGVNASAFLGYRMGKVPGAIAATLGITLPTFIIVFALSAFYSLFQHEPKVQAAFKGIHGAIIGLIVVAAYKMGKSALFDRTTVAVAVSTLIVLLLTGMNPTIMILIGLGIGVVIVRVKKLLGLSVRTEKEYHDQPQPVIEYYI
ncbi:chromate transporter [Paenibacillus medicaginis]|uniref:Chromate transporter n=1 Tax=Paenibacillus medicaginis TaxID=1470560 RepID=A0ABV5C890_9BACL